MPGSFSKLTGGAKRFCVLCAILLLAVALRIYCFGGYWGTDDGEYARLANAMASGTFAEFVQDNYVKDSRSPAIFPFRVGFIYPLALLFRFFGVSEIVLVIYPLLISICGVLAVFLCGRLLFGINAGLISAAIWSVLPQDVKLATTFVPDAIASFYGSAGVLVLLFVIIPTVESRTSRLLAGLLAGLLFGISWLTKESIVYLAPFCLILLFLDIRKNVNRALPLWAGVAVASVGIFLAEMLVYYFQAGDLFLRMHENERSLLQTKSYFFSEGSRFGWPVGGSRSKELLKRLFLHGPSKIFFNKEFLFLPFIGLIAAGHSFFWRDRAYLIPACWMLSLGLMYNFGSVSLSSYAPLPLFERYMHPILLPAAVLTGGFITQLLSTTTTMVSRTLSNERFFWGALIGCMLVSLSGYWTFRLIRDVPYQEPIYEVKKVAALITPKDVVYTDPLSAKALEFYWKYPKDMKIVNFDGMRAVEIKRNSFVLVDKYRLDWLMVNANMWLTKDYGYHEPEFMVNVPETWKRLWRNEYATLYRVDNR